MSPVLLLIDVKKGMAGLFEHHAVPPTTTWLIFNHLQNRGPSVTNTGSLGEGSNGRADWPGAPSPRACLIIEPMAALRPVSAAAPFASPFYPKQDVFSESTKDSSDSTIIAFFRFSNATCA